MQNSQYEANKRYIDYFDDLEVVKDCLTGDWLYLADINYNDCFVLREAIKRYDKPMLDFLLLEPQLNGKAKLNYGKGALLKSALENTPIAFIEMMLTDSRIPNKVDLFCDGFRLIEHTLQCGRLDVIQFLLSDTMLPLYENKYPIEEYSNRKLLESNHFEALEWLWTVKKGEFHYRKIDLFYSHEHFSCINQQNSLWLAQYFSEHDSKQFIEAFKLNLLYKQESKLKFWGIKSNSFDDAIQYLDKYDFNQFLETKLKVKNSKKEKKTKI